ncbi:MAG TPA: response regulator [Sphingomicrobium sp.]|nr:response regulator [Sphingomicrobium sp.]
MTRPKVLVVEDEALLAMTLEDWLEEWDFEVVGPAMNLKTAAELAAGAAIDAAILDVNIGGTPSFEIAKLLEGRGIPYLFATGYGVAAERGAGAGVRVVQKPYQSDELREAVAVLLAR